MFNKIKLYVFIVIVMIALIVGIYLVVDFNNTAKELVDAESIGITSTSHSKGQFYQDYEEMMYTNQNGDESTGDDGSVTPEPSPTPGPSPTPTPGPGDLDKEKVKQILESNPKYAPKAEILSETYAAVLPIFGLNGTIGLMANVVEEGDLGVIERSFANKDSNLQPNPVKYKKQIEYLKNKGDGISLGLGFVQWSRGRRVALCDIYLRNLGDNDDVSKEVMFKSEMEMLANELSKGTSYNTSIVQAANSKSNTVEAWAEAFSDYYFISKQSCYFATSPPSSSNKMKTMGDACKRRCANASELASMLGAN